MAQTGNCAILTRCGVYIDTSNVNQEAIIGMRKYFTIKHFDHIKKQLTTVCAYKNVSRTCILVPRFGFQELLNSTEKKHQAIVAGLKLTGIRIDIPIATPINSYNAYLYRQAVYHTILPPEEKIPSNTIIEKHPAIASLKGFQRQIVNYICTYHYSPERMRAGFAGLNLHLGTGTGKTFILSALIHCLDVRTLVIVHNTPAALDIHAHLMKYLPHREIGIYYKDKKIFGDIVVMIINSACKAPKYPYKFSKRDPMSSEEFYKLWDFIVFDESHKYTSAYFSKVFVRCQSRYMLGLSASPDENARGLDPIAMWNIGPLFNPKEHIAGLDEVNQPFVGVIQKLEYYGPASHTMRSVRENGDLAYDQIVEQLVWDPYRTSLIVASVMNLLKLKHCIYVFSDRIDHLIIMRDAVLAEIKVSAPQDCNSIVNYYPQESEICIINGELDPKEVDALCNKARVIFTIVQFLGTGKSIPRMTAAILAIGHRRGTNQCIGRIFRPGDHNTNQIPRVIVDIVDMRTNLVRQYPFRKKIYDAQIEHKRYLTVQEGKYEYQNLKPITITHVKTTKKERKLGIKPQQPVPLSIPGPIALEEWEDEIPDTEFYDTPLVQSIGERKMSELFD